MRILFVAPRYHTNQVPIVNGLLKEGHEVLFWVNYIGEIEEHSNLVPQVMEKAFLQKLLYKKNQMKRSSKAEDDIRVRFIPSIAFIVKGLKTKKPDIVIIRDRSIANMIIYICCRLLGIKRVILYNQTPLYPKDTKMNPIKKIVAKTLYPRVRYSPITYFGHDEYMSFKNEMEHKKISRKQLLDNISDKEHAYFVPLVYPYDDKTLEKCYMKDGVLNIVDVGKYRGYKNHFLVLKAVKLAVENNPHLKLHITLIGQVTNEDEKQYYKEMQQDIIANQLQDYVTLKKNVSYCEMQDIYTQYDVLILPSLYESAGMVILEAMANGLCVVCSDTCGLASYLTENECGYVFQSRDEKELCQALLELSKDNEKVGQLGRKAAQIVKDKYQYSEYKTALNQLLEKEFHYSI